METQPMAGSEVVGERLRELFRELYLGKHPHLQEFVNAPSCALLAIAVRRDSGVNRFQHLIELAVTP
jgi:hypothetical protein